MRRCVRHLAPFRWIYLWAAERYPVVVMLEKVLLEARRDKKSAPTSGPRTIVRLLYSV